MAALALALGLRIRNDLCEIGELVLHLRRLLMGEVLVRCAFEVAICMFLGLGVGERKDQWCSKRASQAQVFRRVLGRVMVSTLLALYRCIAMAGVVALVEATPHVAPEEAVVVV